MHNNCRIPLKDKFTENPLFPAFGSENGLSPALRKTDPDNSPIDRKPNRQQKKHNPEVWPMEEPRQEGLGG
ncbi:hypothetical protein ACLOJK_013941 [Asimina triloba]